MKTVFFPALSIYLVDF